MARETRAAPLAPSEEDLDKVAVSLASGDAKKVREALGDVFAKLARAGTAAGIATLGLSTGIGPAAAGAAAVLAVKWLMARHEE
jgi:hypothetical protein